MKYFTGSFYSATDAICDGSVFNAEEQKALGVLSEQLNRTIYISLSLISRYSFAQEMRVIFSK